MNSHTCFFMKKNRIYIGGQDQFTSLHKNKEKKWEDNSFSSKLELLNIYSNKELKVDSEFNKSNMCGKYSRPENTWNA